MSDPPEDRIAFLIRFVCAAIFFGIVIALIGLRFVDSASPSSLAIWSILTIAISLIAARRGDDAWKGLAQFFRWW